MAQTTTLLAHMRLPKRGWRAIWGGFIALVMAGAALVASPTAALAEPRFNYRCEYSHVSCQNGALDSSFSSDKCKGSGQRYAYTLVCVTYNGDYIYVRDAKADGHSAIGTVKTRRVGGPEKICRNRHGYRTWARCNFNWPEREEKWVSGGYRVDNTRFWMNHLWGFRRN